MVSSGTFARLFFSSRDERSNKEKQENKVAGISTILSRVPSCRLFSFLSILFIGHGPSSGYGLVPPRGGGRLQHLLPLPALWVRHGQQPLLLTVLVHADERVRVIFLVEVAEGMVDAAVARLVGPDVQDEVLHGAAALGHVPVRHGNVGDLELGVAPLGEVAFVELADTARVCVHGLLLEVAHEAMADPGADEVGEEHGVLWERRDRQHVISCGVSPHADQREGGWGGWDLQSIHPGHP